MEINGYTLTLIDGDLHISKDGVLIQKTKGDPTKRGNPPFATIEAAAEYFNLYTGFAQPVDPPVDPSADPSVAQ